MRPQSEDDKLGWQMVNRFLHHLRHEMAQEKPLKKRYVDCTREAAPQEDETPAFPREERPEGFDQQALEEEQQPDVPLAVAEIAPEGVSDPIPMVGDEEVELARGDVRPRPGGETLDEEPPAQRPRIQDETPFRGTSTSLTQRETQPVASWHGWQAQGSTQNMQKGVVQVSSLSPPLQKLFLRGSRLKESQAVKETLEPVEASQARKILADPGANVIPTRWLDVWKEVGKADSPTFPTELNVPRGLVPKSRWILQGFHDSAARELNRSVTTCEQHELLFVLQVLCDNAWRGLVGDVSAAFTQANMSLPQNQRTEDIYVKAPNNGELPCFPGVHLFKLKVELYGLMTGPLCWKNTLFHECSKLGFVLHPLGSCTLLWYHPVTGNLEGIMLAQVDDVLVGGDHQDFKDTMSKLQLSQASEFNGRHIVQVKDEIHVDMVEYVKKLKPIPVENKKEISTEGVVTQYRALIGALSWACRGAVPQGVGDCSILAAQTTSLTWADVKELNRSLMRLQETTPILRILKLPRGKTLLIFCDASLSNLKDGRTQVSMVMGWINTREYRQRGSSRFSVQEWTSRKYPRAVSSTLCTEAAAMSMALAAGEWLLTWHDMCYSRDYEEKRRQSRCLPLQHIQKEKEPLMDRIVVVTDSKSIYDVLAKKSVGGIDKRAGLELQIVFDSFATYQGSCRWVPHHKNLADAMTKLRANWPPLRQALSQARVSITPEVEELEQRSEHRKMTGKAVARLAALLDEAWNFMGWCTKQEA
eukprot:3458900-Amphidinium_carterae.1